MGVNVIVRWLKRGHVTHPNTSREPLHTRHENTYPYDNLTLTIRHYWKAAVPTVPRPWPVRSFLLLSRARPTVGSCVFVRWRLRYTALEWTFSCRHYWSQCGVGCKTSRSTNVCKYIGGYRYVSIRITYSYGYKAFAKFYGCFPFHNTHSGRTISMKTNYGVSFVVLKGLPLLSSVYVCCWLPLNAVVLRFVWIAQKWSRTQNDNFSK